MPVERTPPPSRLASVLAVAVLLVGLASIAVTAWWLARVEGLADYTTGLPGFLALVLAVLAFLVSGVAIVSKQPRNVIGWLLVIPGIFPQLSDLVFAWLAAMDPPPQQADLGLWLGVWFSGWAWILLIFPIFLILLTFPNGRLLSPRWRWVVVLIGLMTIVMVGLSTFSQELEVLREETALWSISNPIGFITTSGDFIRTFDLAWSMALLVATVTSVAAVVVRFRSGSPEERAQFKWPLWGVLFFGLTFGLGVIGSRGEGWIVDVVIGPSLAAIPVSIAIAVLKYRLYEIDRIISRTVSYALVVGVLAFVFFGTIAALTSLLSADSDLAVAGSTLAAAALFNPLRTRVQGVVDRRFNRSRYDTAKVMDGFVGSLQDRVDESGIMEEWVDVVATTMQPVTVGVWMRDAT